MSEVNKQQIKDALERRLKIFIDQPYGMAFLIGVHDYIDYAIHNTTLYRIMREQIQKERDEDTEKLATLEAQALNELDAIYKKLASRAKKQRIDNNDILENLLKCTNVKSGKILTSKGVAGTMYDNIRDALRTAMGKGLHDFAKDYAEAYYEGDNPTRIGIRYHISGAMLKYMGLRLLMERREKTSTWGALENLLLIHRAIESYNGRVFFDDGNDDDLWNRIASAHHPEFLASTIENIEEGADLTRTYLFSRDAKQDALKVHNLLLDGLDSYQAISQKTHPISNDTLKAIYENGVLQIGVESIDFNSKPTQRDLLETIFRKSGWWNYYEIQDDWDVAVDANEYPKDFWRKFYMAADDINTEVALKAKIEKFLEKDGTRRIRINPQLI